MNKHKFYLDDTGFLFSDPSFVSGLGSVLDIGGGFLVYNTSRNGSEADERAIASDWAIVGKDLLTAVKALGTQAKQAKTEKAK